MSDVVVIENEGALRAVAPNWDGPDEDIDVSNLSDREYRAIKRLSYSSLKQFIDDRMDYYEVHELGTKSSQKKSYEMTFGVLVETLLWGKANDYSETFVEATVPKPAGHMGELLDKLYELHMSHRDANGVATRQFDSLLEEAYKYVAYDASGNLVKFKRKKFADILLGFPNSEAEQYYQQMLANTDKYLVDLKDKGFAENCKNKLLHHWVTRDIVSRKSDERYDIYYQLIVLFTYRGIKMKSKMDMVEVDHHLRRIFIYDLKTTFDVEDFNFSYRKYRYYIQAFLYWIAVMNWAARNGMGSYTVTPMEFIVADSKAKLAPLRRKIKKKNMVNARDGFRHQGKWFIGVDQAIDALQWHRQTGIWDMSKDNYENHGISGIKIYEDESGEVDLHNIISPAGTRA